MLTKIYEKRRLLTVLFLAVFFIFFIYIVLALNAVPSYSGLQPANNTLVTNNSEPGLGSLTFMDATTGGNCSQADVVGDAVDGTDGPTYCEFTFDYDASAETTGEFKWSNYNPPNLSSYDNITWQIEFDLAPTDRPSLNFYCAGGFNHRFEYLMAGVTAGNNTFNIAQDDFISAGTCDWGSIVDIVIVAANSDVQDDTLVHIYSINATTTTVGTASVVLNATVDDANVSDTLEVSFMNASDDGIICTNSSISTGSTVRCLWSGLDTGSDHQWYINVSDGTDVNTSGDYNFTFREPNYAPSFSNFAPANDTSLEKNTNSVDLNITATDANGGDTLTVSFVNQSDDAIICTNSSISPGSTVRCNWANILPSTEHKWYVNVSDGSEINTSAIYNFSINPNSFPSLSTFQPANNSAVPNNEVNNTQKSTLRIMTPASNCSIVEGNFDFAEGTHTSDYCQLTYDYDHDVATNGEIKWKNIFNNTIYPGAYSDLSDVENFTMDIYFDKAPTDAPFLFFYCDGFNNRYKKELTGLSSGLNSISVSRDSFDVIGSCTWSTLEELLIWAGNADLQDDTIVRVYDINATYSDAVEGSSFQLNVTALDGDAGESLDVTFYNASDNVAICSNTSISPNTVVSCLWQGLSNSSHQWYVNISDGIGVNMSGTYNFSINSPPTVSNINITPNIAFTNNTLTCDWSYSDPNGQAEDNSEAKWYVDGSLVETDYYSGTYPTLTSDNFNKGENVTCAVRGHDGSNYGESVNTSILISNLAPELSNFDPTNNTRDIWYSNYVINVTYSDTDSDSGTVSFINASDDSIFCTNTSVASSTVVSCSISTSAGTDIQWYANATDGSNITTSLTYNVSMNTLPVVSDINITPDTAFTNNTLTCDWTYSDANSDAQGATTINWYVEGSLVETDTYSGSFPTLTSANFNKGENVTCAVSGFDGYNYGVYVNTSMLISNLKPELSNFAPANDTTDIYYSNYVLNVTYTDTDSDAGTVYFINQSDGSTICTNNSVASGSSVGCAISDSSGGYFQWYVNASDGSNMTMSSGYNFSMNILPVITNINITPDTAYTNDTLTCDWTYSDGNGDAQGDTEVKWYVDGSLVQTDTYSGSFPTLGSTNYTKGQNVTCAVRGNDGKNFANSVNTSMLISNLVPILTNFAPTNNTKDIWYENYVLNVTYTDTDSDTATVAFVNSSDDAVFCSNTSVSTGTTVGCSITTTSGMDIQWYVNATDTDNVTTSSVYNVTMNALPVATNVNVTPDTAYTNSTLTCDWTYTDANNDAQGSTTVKWYVDNILIETDTYSGSWPTLASTNFEKGEEVKCAVNVTDDYNPSNIYVNDTVTISNLAPTFTSVSMDVQGGSAPAKKADTITCAQTGRNDLDGDTMTDYFKFLDSDNTTILQDWSTTSTFDCSGDADCTKGDYIMCQVRVYDGTEYSVVKNSTISVVNTIPEAQSVSVLPSSPNNNDDINCSYTYYDIDGDSESDQFYQWYNESVLTDIIIFEVGSGNTTAGESWKCEVTVYDGEDNSTAVNSTSVTIDSTSPSISVITTVAEVDVGVDIQFNWTWTDPDLPSGTYTHFVCNSSSVTASGCGDKQLCNVTTSTSPANCSYNPPQADPHSNTAYFLVKDELEQTSAVESKAWLLNHNATASNVSLNVTSTGVINTYTCMVNGAADTDSDSLSSRYTFLFGDTTLQAESATNTFIVSSGVGTHGENITCSGRVYDGRTYSIPYTIGDHLRTAIPTYSNNRVTNQELNVTYTIYNTSSIDGSNITINDPFSVQTINEATYNSDTGQYNYSFSPTVTGAWTVVSVFTTQGDGQSYLFKGSNDQFTVSSPPTGSEPSGGGGGGSPSEKTVIPISTTNITGYCGDGICQQNENPAACWQDCKVNYDTLITCVWDEDIECNWSQNWFPVFLVGLLALVGVLSVYQYEIRQRR